MNQRGHKMGTETAENPTTPNRLKRTADEQTAARLLDLHAAARYMGVSYWTMRDLVLNGMVPSVKLPCPRAHHGRTIRRVLIDRLDLDEFIDLHKETY